MNRESAVQDVRQSTEHGVQRSAVQDTQQSTEIQGEIRPEPPEEERPELPEEERSEPPEYLPLLSVFISEARSFVPCCDAFLLSPEAGVFLSDAGAFLSEGAPE